MIRALGSIGSLLVLAASARLTIDVGLDVPVSMQSLAVCLIAYFDRYAVHVVLMYLLIGGLGLPVFADGAAGWNILFGNSCGYLVGFVLAALYMRYSLSDGSSSTYLLQVLTVATIVILVSGFAWLVVAKSASIAWTYGVLPYVPGAVVKVVLAWLIVVGYRCVKEWKTAV